MALFDIKKLSVGQEVIITNSQHISRDGVYVAHKTTVTKIGRLYVTVEYGNMQFQIPTEPCQYITERNYVSNKLFASKEDYEDYLYGEKFARLSRNLLSIYSSSNYTSDMWRNIYHNICEVTGNPELTENDLGVSVNYV